MSSTDATRQEVLAAKERQLRASIEALPADYLARIGLASPAAVDAHIAAEMADEAEALR